MRSPTHYTSNRQAKRRSRFGHTSQSISNRFVQWHCQNRCGQRQCGYPVARCEGLYSEGKAHVFLGMRLSRSQHEVWLYFLIAPWRCNIISQRAWTEQVKQLSRYAARSRRRRRAQESMPKDDPSGLLRSLQESATFGLIDAAASLPTCCSGAEARCGRA